MKYSISLLALLFICQTGFSQLIEFTEYIPGNVEYQKEGGLFHGEYSSHYKNGNPKAKGEFYRNMRTGVWTFWSEDGEREVQKDFSELWSPKVISGNENSSSVEYKARRNKEGFFEYYDDLDQDNILYVKRVWRDADIDENPVFEETEFFKLLAEGVESGQIQAYDTDSELDREFTDLDVLHDLRYSGVRIKEELFFDTDRNTHETRIIGLSPLSSDNQSGELKPVYSLYYPEARSFFAGIEFSKDEELNHIDDWFILRRFESSVYNELNLKMLPLHETLKEGESIDEARLRVELEMIENVNELHLEY